MTDLSIRLRVDLSAACSLGPGKIALLERIHAAGSLSQAARELRMSYRRAWLLLQSVNGGFRQPLVTLSTGGRGGGGARLTPFGHSVVETYRNLERDTGKRAESAFADILPFACSKPRRTPMPRRPLNRRRVREPTA